MAAKSAGQGNDAGKEWAWLKHQLAWCFNRPKPPQIRADTSGQGGYYPALTTQISQALPKLSIQRRIRFDAQVLQKKKNKPEDVIYGAIRRFE